MKIYGIYHRLKNKGFTFIEVLMVISIVALMTSILMASVNIVRAKARDAEKREQIAQVKNALAMQYADKGEMPKNYLNNDGTFNSEGTGGAIAFEDRLNATSPSNLAYEASMNELVAGGHLTAIPHSPNSNMPYGYYNYGSGSAAGAMFGTMLETSSVTSVGEPGTCRPFSGYVDYEFWRMCLSPTAYFYDDPVLGHMVCPFEMSDPEYQYCYASGCTYPDDTTKCYAKLYVNGSQETIRCESYVPSNWCNTENSTYYCVCNPY